MSILRIVHEAELERWQAAWENRVTGTQRCREFKNAHAEVGPGPALASEAGSAASRFEAAAQIVATQDRQLANLAQRAQQLVTIEKWRVEAIGRRRSARIKRLVFLVLFALALGTVAFELIADSVAEQRARARGEHARQEATRKSEETARARAQGFSDKLQKIERLRTAWELGELAKERDQITGLSADGQSYLQRTWADFVQAQADYFVRELGAGGNREFSPRDRQAVEQVATYLKQNTADTTRIDQAYEAFIAAQARYAEAARLAEERSRAETAASARREQEQKFATLAAELTRASRLLWRATSDDDRRSLQAKLSFSQLTIDSIEGEIVWSNEVDSVRRRFIGRRDGRMVILTETSTIEQTISSQTKRHFDFIMGSRAGTAAVSIQWEILPDGGVSARWWNADRDPRRLSAEFQGRFVELSPTKPEAARDTAAPKRDLLADIGLLSRLFAHRLSGEASSTQAPQNRYPVTYELLLRDDGTVTGSVNWATLGAEKEVEGSYEGGVLTLREVSETRRDQGSRALFGINYQLLLKADSLPGGRVSLSASGSWTHPATNAKGSVNIQPFVLKL